MKELNWTAEAKGGVVRARDEASWRKALPCESEFPEPTQGQTDSSGAATSVLPQEGERQAQESP